MARGKILLALQYWDGDKQSAMELAKLLARAETAHSRLADILFVARYDCVHDMTAIKKVSQRFNVHTYTSRRRGTGWPHGSNDLFFATMEWVYNWQSVRKIDYKAVFTIEGDACPLTPDWLPRLSEEWDRCGAQIMGSLQQTPVPHINGNALFSTEPGFLHWLTRKIVSCPAHVGWDVYLSDSFKKRGWWNTRLMRSFWGCKTLPADHVAALVQDGAVFLHGVKDSSVRDFFSQKYLSRPN